MKLLTCRYGAAETIKKSGAVPVRISIGAPRWRTTYPLLYSVPELMPSRAWLKLPLEAYLPLYLKQLSAAGLPQIRTALENIAKAAKNDSLVLLCFEDLRKPEEWCHRTHFAAWWKTETGEKVVELEPGAPAEVAGPAQSALL